MRTLFIINAVGLYLHCMFVVTRFAGWNRPKPIAQDATPESIHLAAYTDVVPFAIFAILGCFALWHGIGWPRVLVAVLILPPGVLGSFIYAGWWIGII